MSYNDILEIADSIKRTSHRVKNSGDDLLAELGLKTAKKAKKQTSLKHARMFEQEYLWVLKEKYFPVLPKDKIVPTITSMAGYDDSGNDGGHVETSVPTGDSIVAQEDNNSTSNHGNVDTIIIYENLNAEHQIMNDHVDDGFYTPKEGEKIITNKEVEGKISDIAKDYHEATGKSLTITEGFREPEDQAQAMFNKLENGEDLNKLYSNKEALNEVLEAYKEATESGKSNNEIVENMANVIKEQTQDDIFISRHLTEKAFDARSRDMNEDEKSAFIQAVEKSGGKVIVEGDHLHVQF